MAQISSLEERAARIEGILEELRARVSRVETEISELRREMRSNFQWMLGIMFGVLIPMWVSIILAVVFSS